MYSENAKVTDQAGATVTNNSNLAEQMQAIGEYTVTCVGADGQTKWEEKFKNLVVTVGKNDMLTQYFTAASYAAAWYMGLVDGTSSPSYSASDTMASHSWTEYTNYSASTRPAPSWGSASGGSLSTTATSYSINSSGGTVAGAFMVTNSTKGGTSGTLYSAGNFTGGSRTVVSGDTLNVTYTATLT